MDRFDRTGARLDAFTKALWDALVPSSGECVSVQGELVRANQRLRSEHFRNGMANYYRPDEPDQGFAESYYGALLLFVIGTLLENANGALTAEGVAYFTAARARASADWTRQRRIDGLLFLAEEEDRELTHAERVEIEALEAAAPRPDFEELFDRSAIAIANYCLANPELFDRSGRPVVERGVRDIRELIERRPPGTPLH